MSDQQLIDLYSGRILALAADIPLCDPLIAPMVEVKRRAPLCGSTMTVQFDVENGKITRFGQNVKACALGQAAASVVAQNIIGADRDLVTKARDQLRAMLDQEGAAPDAPFDELKVLIPARSFANRHASILLSLDAIVEGFERLDRPT